MSKTSDLPPLSLVQPGATSLQPPRKLGKHGASLWNRILAEFAITDAGGIELLCLAAQALDRAESLAAAIASDGPVIYTRGGTTKSHPAVREELQNRAFVARTLERLGVTVENVKPAGRPPKGVGWIPEE